MVDVVLECRWGFAQAKRCHQHFIESETGDERCEPFMAFSDTDFVECGDYIEFRVKSSAAQGIECFTDEWERVPILDCNVIQSSVIVADPYTFSWLGGEYEWSRGGGR